MSGRAAARTAFVLAGSGSFGAVQVGMLRESIAHGVEPDLVVGSSVGAINGAYLAGAPARRRRRVWRGWSQSGADCGGARCFPSRGAA